MALKRRTGVHFLVVHRPSAPLIGIILIVDSYFPPIAAVYERPFAWNMQENDASWQQRATEPSSGKNIRDRVYVPREKTDDPV